VNWAYRARLSAARRGFEYIPLDDGGGSRNQLPAYALLLNRCQNGQSGDAVAPCQKTDKEVIAMPSFYRSSVLATPSFRSIGIAALMGATILVTPLAVRAATTTDATQGAAPKSAAAMAATDTKGESVEQRITSLHAALKITPDEESKWNSVAQAMRENAAAMDKEVAETRTTPPQNMTAVDDLKTYQKFAQLHVDGLKNLISSFSGLYSSMPDGQKKVADQVFQTARTQNTASN
jgi:protein CpxP